ncbi:MBL fold metallo-hydrolase [Roseomonas terrae]|uniref:MBL fold metallo-hydrolase n=1 Tax=Neoroseomonas terrae TaxID=424799 RepID=A0ABS5ELX3_9PROT|nr:MBL fold metallo-hydrolase [Neoroseomonas terrae]MBR0652030.1 MBL fold metallo-hydrolase [Neoroseomonas terrae]
MRRLTIGDVTISSIIERDGPWQRPEVIFPGAAAEPELLARRLAEVPPESYDPATGRLVLTYQTFVVRTPHHTILVDTCTGEDKGYKPPMDFSRQPWRDGLRREGLSFDDIDYVFCTHLHIDHTGWNTVLKDGRWVPTFPRARYIFHRREYAAWEAATRAGEKHHGGGGRIFRFNCEPVVEAGQAMLVDDDFMLDDRLTIEATPGHSPCHCCLHIRSGGEHAVITGDLMHHALQVMEPDWSTPVCWDPQQAAASRRRFFARTAGSGTRVLPVHFPDPTVGRIEEVQGSFRWVPLR